MEKNIMHAAWGYHLLVNCSAGKAERFTEENIKTFITNLIRDIDMVAYGEPMITKFAELSIDKAGYSFCQMIETSNITGHFVDSNGNFYIDIFSCKTFEPEAAISLINAHFEPTRVSSRMLGRNASEAPHQMFSLESWSESDPKTLPDTGDGWAFGYSPYIKC